MKTNPTIIGSTDPYSYKSVFGRIIQFHVAQQKGWDLKGLDIKYPCRQCDYRATTKEGFAQHNVVEHK